MSGVTRRALRVYAALEDLRGDGQDILDAIIPFFEPILEKMHGKFFEPRLFAVAVQRLYRWRFTADIAESFVPRLERKGYLKKNGGNTKPVYIVNFEPRKDTSNELPIAEVVEKLVDEFENFPRKIGDLLNYSRTREELTDILIRFLVSLDSYREETLTTEAFRALDPEAKSFLSQLDAGGSAMQPDDRYIAARFVQYICSTKSDYVSHLSRLASIGLLTEVVQDFVKPTQAADKSNLTVVLDAPLALDYLGCSGTHLRADVESIIDALKNVGCRFVVFPISCEEMQRNLNSMLSNPAPLRHGYTHEAMLKGQVLEPYVRAVANDPETALERAGIHVRQLGLTQFPNSHQYFPAEMYEDFFSYINWVPDVAPREHDATCMALIMRLREGKHYSDVYRCNYVFVTRNPTYARMSRTYCVDSKLITSIQSGPVISQRELAVTAWLRTGLGSKSVPAAHLMAICDRVLRIKSDVRDAVANTLSSVTPELLPQFEALLLDQRSVRRLADATFNNPAVVSTENAHQLLAAMKEATTEEERARHGQEVQKLKAEQEQGAFRANQEIAKIAAELDAARFALERVQAKEQAQFQDCINGTNTIIRRTERALMLVLSLLAVAGVIDLLTGWLGDYLVWKVLAVVAGIVGGYHLLTDVAQVPKVGLATVLNSLARWMLSRKLALLKLGPKYDAKDVSISRGQISTLKGARPTLISEDDD